MRQVDLEGFRARLEVAIERVGSPARAVRAAGMSSSGLAKWRDGSEPGFAKLARLAAAARVSLDWLAYGDAGAPAEGGPNRAHADDLALAWMRADAQTRARFLNVLADLGELR